jgi:hypothetical protein
MTFEFAPDWMEAMLRSSEYSPASLGSSPLLPTAIPPAHPDAREMAALVGELFAEGTLSAEQFHSLLAAPELAPYGAPPPRPHVKMP